MLRIPAPMTVLAWCLGLMLLVAVGWHRYGPAEAAPAPLVQMGETYLFVWGFYMEVLTIDAELPDGWLRVHEPSDPGRSWTVNTRQTLAITVAKPVIPARAQIP